MSDVRIAKSGKHSVCVASARRASFVWMSFGVRWLCLGIGAVAATMAVCLPLPHDHSTPAPESRISIVNVEQTPDFDFAETQFAETQFAQIWRERSQLSDLTVPALRQGQDNAWMPDGGLSTLMATRFPSSGKVRLPLGVELAAPLPLPRPEGIARQELAHQGVAPNTPPASEPQVAVLPPQTKPRELGILDRLFGDPDRAAKALLAANPKAALYDITKRAVYLPDGDKLEAHSGFGASMDDPASVARKGYGVTPPNVYAVSFREKLFHGVRALRLKPVGSGHMYGRDGILAHSYMLGAEGASNGCVSVRDYDKFVQAYEAGKFDRIIVVRSADEPAPAVVAGAAPGGA